jgi:type I restriction enzyme R subunit
MLARLRSGNDAEERSGVVWHTQGSGKSLTMVFVARMIRASEDLSDFKIVMVNDRVDLEKQLTQTAKLIGGKVNVIDSSDELRKQLGTDASDLNMVMVHKFMEREVELPASLKIALVASPIPRWGKNFGIVNRSERILLMIDEAHRTQGSDLGDNVFEAFPNATRIAFTGTPLITEKHGNKRTVKRFGDYIDTYKLMDAVEDGATLQILYEGRTAETALKDKHGFDTKFEDLFRKRNYAEIEAIKKKYGAYGDLLEAENRIGAIARDLVNHYVNNILPDGFKAQVVCHSKIAAIRYQKSIREALTEQVDSERQKNPQDAELIRRLEFLKVAVVVSSDATNELAQITEARKESKRWNAVENFCKPFDLEDRDKELTGIAFLVVCDMLLTGFDAPIEQVMYIDKRLKEHNLLQAIARVNRVTKGKQRGFIVDYIGLANNLTEALSIYTGEDADDLMKGLKNVSTELPILEERYRRLIQHFHACGVSEIEPFTMEKIKSPEAEVKVIHEAITAMKDIKRRADFEVYLKKFLQSLNLILPHPSGHAYRGPARRFGYLLRMTKERYKDESLDIADAGAKVRALINEHLIDLGINPKIPPVELLSPDFMAQVHRHASGNSEAKASEMEHAIRKHCTIHFDEDPAFYKKLSEKLEKLIEDHKNQWDVLAKEMEPLVHDAIAGRKTNDQGTAKEARIFEDHIADLAFGESGVPPEHRQKFSTLVINLIESLQGTIDIIHFWAKPIEVKRLRGNIDTELLLCGIPEISARHERIAIEVTKLAEKRHEELLR